MLMPGTTEIAAQHLAKSRQGLPLKAFDRLALLLLAHSPLVPHRSRLDTSICKTLSEIDHHIGLRPFNQFRVSFTNLCDVDNDSSKTALERDLDYGSTFQDLDDDDDEEKARVEEVALRDAPPLPLSPSNVAAEVLRKEGVVMVGDVLTEEEAQLLRKEILTELGNHHGASNRFTDVLASHDPEKVERRWDLMLKNTVQVQKCLSKLLSSVVGDVIESAAGADAELFELAAFISTPGSQPQPLHPDTEYEEHGLFTALVPLQHISESMGPTRFLRGSHTKEAHDAFFYGDVEEDYDVDLPIGEDHNAMQEEDNVALLGSMDENHEEGSFLEKWQNRAARGPFEVGDVAIYDSRVLHAGSQNFHSLDDLSNGTRVLFYVTFKPAEADIDNNVRSLLPEVGLLRYTLSQLRDSRGNVFQNSAR